MVAPARRRKSGSGGARRPPATTRLFVLAPWTAASYVATIQRVERQVHGKISKGFTLVELMVIIAVVAILAAVAMPSYRELMDNYRVRKAGEDVISLIANARSNAVKLHRQVNVSFASGASWCAGAKSSAAPTAGSLAGNATACDCTGDPDWQASRRQHGVGNQCAGVQWRDGRNRRPDWQRDHPCFSTQQIHRDRHGHPAGAVQPAHRSKLIEEYLDEKAGCPSPS